METPDQASYLARRLLGRAADLEAVLLDDGVRDPLERAKRRQEMIAKLLAVEAGVYDGIAVQRVEAALPSLASGAEASPQEEREFAAFLRRYLNL
jgi:hypothetical protein